jgi:SAM-dependent methyltransferase
MNRLLILIKGSFDSDKPLQSRIKLQVLGIAYLLLHPSRLKRIVVRETLYGDRHQSKAGWLAWQAYDQYTAHLLHGTAESQARPINVARIKIITDMVSSGGNGLRVLDVGCGAGIISEHVFKMGNSVTCADLPTITSLTHKRRDLLVVTSDAEQLAFAPNSFDVIIALEILEHLWNPHGFLDEAYRVLGPNGRLIIEVPEGKEGLRWDSHMQYFTLESLKQMSGQRFTVSAFKRLDPVEGVPTPTIIMMLSKSAAKNNYDVVS